MAWFSHSASSVPNRGSSLSASPCRCENPAEAFLPSPQYLLKLYVTGTSSRAELAVTNLRRICEEDLKGRYELQVIDVMAQPQLAEDEKILATPTLIKQLPLPLRRVIGDLSDREKVLLGLDLLPLDPNAAPTNPSRTANE